MDNNQEKVNLENETETEEKKQEIPKRFRENLYSRINVSLKTMDLIIGIFVLLLIVFVAFGIWQANIR